LPGVADLGKVDVQPLMLDLLDEFSRLIRALDTQARIRTTSGSSRSSAMKADLSSAAIGVRLARTSQLRTLCLTMGAVGRAARWRFAVGQDVMVSTRAHAVIGPGLRGRVVGRRLGSTELGFGRAYLLELVDGRTVEVNEPLLAAS
jgi:hypothetical protein